MQTTSNKNDLYTLHSVDNALTMIELLSVQPDIGVAEIARKLSLGKSTAFRLLATLENREFVKKDPNNKYSLGLKFAHFGSQVLERFDIIKYARPFLEGLTALLRETTHLVVWEEGDLVRFIDKVIGSSTIHMDSHVGLVKPAYTTGTGKVLLAFKTDEFINSYLQKAQLQPVTPYTCNSSTELHSQLISIRKNGYGSDINESEVGLTCYAAPIFNANGSCIAAISVSGSSERIKLNLEEVIRKVMDTARLISDSLK